MVVVGTEVEEADELAAAAGLAPVAVDVVPFFALLGEELLPLALPLLATLGPAPATVLVLGLVKL